MRTFYENSASVLGLPNSPPSHSSRHNFNKPTSSIPRSKISTKCSRSDIRYVKKHCAANASENEQRLRENLQESLLDYKNGVKCHCGSDIWVIGSAVVGNACFVCITGEATPSEDYEIAEAVKKKQHQFNYRKYNRK